MGTKTLSKSCKSLSIKIPNGSLVFEMICLVLSSNGEFSKSPSFPVNLSKSLSGFIILVVNPRTFPSKVPSKIDFPTPTNNKSYSPLLATSVILVSMSTVVLKIVFIS